MIIKILIVILILCGLSIGDSLIGFISKKVRNNVIKRASNIIKNDYSLKHYYAKKIRNTFIFAWIIALILLILIFV